MYESPIHLYMQDMYGQIAKQQDEQIYQAIVKCGVDVDKGELIRALQYDRDQYHKGYADGKTDAMAELVRCKDCKHWKCWRSSGEGSGDCNLDEGYATLATQHYDFCSYGEREDDERKAD